jgi:hypothetical protein
MIVKVLTSHWKSARNCLFGKEFQAIAALAVRANDDWRSQLFQLIHHLPAATDGDQAGR